MSLGSNVISQIPCEQVKIEKKKRDWFPIIRTIILSSITLCAVMPLLVLPIISLKVKSEFIMSPLTFPSKLDFENYTEVFQRAKIFKTYGNSFLILICSLVIEIISGSMAAYAITKMKYKHGSIFSAGFLIPMIFPIQSITVPLYLIYRKIGLLNTFTGVILVEAAVGLPIVVFMMTSFMKSIPIQISESAFMDGAGHFTVFTRLIFPLLKPVVSTVAIICGMAIWNDFYMPMIMITDQKKKTIPLKIYDFMGQYNNDWTLVCTCIVYVVVPLIIMYCILQKNIINGVVAGAVKG